MVTAHIHIHAYICTHEHFTHTHTHLRKQGHIYTHNIYISKLHALHLHVLTVVEATIATIIQIMFREAVCVKEKRQELDVSFVVSIYFKGNVYSKGIINKLIYRRYGKTV